MKISAIVLNFKVKKDTLECIKSLKSSTYPVKIYLVDNNSGDDIGEIVSSDKEINFIQNDNNLGYTGGNNVGIKKAIGGSDYIFIINPDVILEKNTIETLVKAAEDYSAGIVGPKVYFEDKKTIWHAGGILDKLNVIGTHLGMDEKDRGQYDKLREVDFISGAAIMIKKQVFEKIGFFDERYFLYYEDADFCFRAKLAGFKILYVPGAIVYHKNAKSTGLGSALQDYYIIRNRMLFAAKFLSHRTRIALLREAIRNLGNPIRRLALFDFLIGKFGKGGFTNVSVQPTSKVC